MKRTKEPGTGTTIRQELAESVPAPDTQKKSKRKTKKAPAPEMRRTKEPETESTGKKLGRKCSDLVPDKFKSAIPDKTPPKNPGRTDKVSRDIQDMTRTRMPLALQEDGEVSGAGQKFRLRGLNQARFNALYAALSEGMTITGACQFAGIQRESYRMWMKKGSEGVFPYTVLYAALKEAEAELERKLINAIIVAGTEKEVYTETTSEWSVDEHGTTSEKEKTVEKTLHPKWQAAAWYLERTRPEFRQNAEAQPSDEGNTEVDDLLAMDATSLGACTDMGGDDEDR